MSRDHINTSEAAILTWPILSLDIAVLCLCLYQVHYEFTLNHFTFILYLHHEWFYILQVGWPCRDQQNAKWMNEYLDSAHDYTVHSSPNMLNLIRINLIREAHKTNSQDNANFSNLTHWKCISVHHSTLRRLDPQKTPNPGVRSSCLHNKIWKCKILRLAEKIL
jgi:hypothetical protein